MKTVRFKLPPLTKANFLAVSESAWAKAQKMERFGYQDISAAMGINVEQATRIVRSWIKERAVEQLHAGQAGAGRSLWRCVPDFVRIEPLRIRTPEENMWLAMRKLNNGFTATDIASHATTETVAVTSEVAAEYCRALLAAEYLAVARRAAPALKREAIYRLVSVTGVQAPVIKRVRALVDPNIGATILIGGVA